MTKIDSAASALADGRAAVQKKAPNAAVSRHLILDVAAGLFAEKGFAETTMRQIAAKAGMQAGSVYYHFASKEQIFGEILTIAMRTIYTAVRGKVDDLGSEATAHDCLHAAIRAHLTVLYSNVHYTSLSGNFWGQLPVEVTQTTLPDRTVYEEYWNWLLRDAWAAGALNRGLSVPLVRPLILGSLNRTVTWFDPNRGNLYDLIATVLVMLDGIWAQLTPSRPSSGRRPK